MGTLFTDYCDPNGPAITPQDEIDCWLATQEAGPVETLMADYEAQLDHIRAINIQSILADIEQRFAEMMSYKHCYTIGQRVAINDCLVAVRQSFADGGGTGQVVLDGGAST